MRLAFHHFRKDLRQFGPATILWLSLLTVAWIWGMGWVQADFRYAVLGGDAAETLLQIGLVLFPSLLVLADSPARRDGFLRTRPLPGRSLLVAKLLFLTFIIIAPAVLQETILLIAQGVSADWVLQATVERCLLATPLALLAAAFAALWANSRQWVTALFCAAGAGWLIIVSIFLLSELLHVRPRFVIDGPPLAYIAIWGWLAAGALTWAAIRNGVEDWSLIRKSVAVAMLIVGLVVAFIFPPATWISAERPLPAQSVAELKAGFKVPMNRIHDQWTSGKATKDENFSISVVPRLSNLPPGAVVSWRCPNIRLEQAGRTVTASRERGHDRALVEWRSRASAADILGMKRLLPGNTLWVEPFNEGDSGNGFFVSEWSPSLQPDRFETPVTLSADLEGHVFQWERTAELPLSAGGTARDQRGAWRVLQVSREIPGELRVRLRRDWLGLLLTRDLNRLRWGGSPANFQEIALYFPEHDLLLLANYSPSQISSGQNSALQRSTLQLDFRIAELGTAQSALGKSGPSAPRLFVFTRSYLGSFDHSWKQPDLLLRNSAAGNFTSSLPQDRQLTRPEFYRRLAAVKVPDFDTASRAEVGRYLYEVLSLISARHQMLDREDPLVQKLAVAVPGHLPMFLDGLRAAEGPAHYVLLEAILRGVQERDIDELVRWVPTTPDVAYVLLARGWVEQGRPALHSLVHRPGNLPNNALPALAWLEDSRTYDRLAEELRSQPWLHTYELLHPLPEFRAQLDRVVRDVWEEQRLSLQSPNRTSAVLSMALRHGIPDALGEGLRLWRLLTPSAREAAWAVLDAFKENLVIDLGDANYLHNRVRVAEWLDRQRAEDWQYDSLRRRWVRKDETRNR